MAAQEIDDVVHTYSLLVFSQCSVYDAHIEENLACITDFFKFY